METGALQLKGSGSSPLGSKNPPWWSILEQITQSLLAPARRPGSSILTHLWPSCGFLHKSQITCLPSALWWLCRTLLSVGTWMHARCDFFHMHLWLEWIRWCDMMCQTNFHPWLCLVKGLFICGRFFCPPCLWRFSQLKWVVSDFWTTLNLLLLPHHVVQRNSIRYRCNYYHKARLFWALGSLHLRNWLFLSPIRSHKT